MQRLAGSGRHWAAGQGARRGPSARLRNTHSVGVMVGRLSILRSIQLRLFAGYFFGSDTAQEQRYLNGTTSGDISIITVGFIGSKNQPGGGAGVGAHHGVERFTIFLHAKAD